MGDAPDWRTLWIPVGFVARAGAQYFPKAFANHPLSPGNWAQAIRGYVGAAVIMGAAAYIPASFPSSLLFLFLATVIVIIIALADIDFRYERSAEQPARNQGDRLEEK
jgi:MFS superfamily sulfate permease-like transporter